MISEAFARLGQIAALHGLFAHPGVAMIALYHDDPESMPADQLRSDAGIVVPEGVALPDGVQELRIPASATASTSTSVRTTSSATRGRG